MPMPRACSPTGAKPRPANGFRRPSRPTPLERPARLSGCSNSKASISRSSRTTISMKGTRPKTPRRPPAARTAKPGPATRLPRLRRNPMTRLNAANEPLAAAYDLALLDLDGVVYLLHQPIREAAATVAALPDLDCEPVFVTNNASRSPETVAEVLRGMDIPAKPDEVLTSAQVVAAAIAERIGSGGKVLSTGSPALYDAVEAAGLTVTHEPREAQAVAFGYTPETTWRDLAAVTIAAREGA